MGRSHSNRAAIGPRLEILDRRDVPNAVAPTPGAIGNFTPATLQTGLVAVGAGPGSEPLVKVFNPDGTTKFSFDAYNPAFRGGVRVALADVNDDGVPDIITAAGPGGGPQVKVFDGTDGTALLANFFAYSPAFTGGVYVAAGDVNGDFHADIITGAGPGGWPHVKVFSGVDFSTLQSFFAFNQAFTGGVFVGAGDVNADNHADVIVGAGAGGGPQVKAFSGTDGSMLANYFAYNTAFPGGVTVASADVNNDGRADIVTGPGAGMQSEVIVRNVADGTKLEDFVALDPTFLGGVFVG